jgi:cellulose synthase/poly-beta-1,6-N-acetylglucosamine synthase-like glycosyltransferase
MTLTNFREKVRNLIDLIGWAYFFVAIVLGVYGTNMLLLTLLFWVLRLRERNKPVQKPVTVLDWPLVTVQLPLYNEQMVARRLIDAVAQLDYPKDRLCIQVLDDSTDETREIAAERVSYWCNQGRWITLIQRDTRSEYKAGALKLGLQKAPGDFVAIFDADFVPPKAWLKNAIQPFFEPDGARIGLVQTRWSHLNADYSPLTRAQALALDGCFGIEQPTRSMAGLFSNFNGTAGIWRRKCIEDAGNWRGVTLSEDMDLSYRAQIQGWRARYLISVEAPAELPTLMIGFKRQQFRWSKGSFQVIKLLTLKLLKSKASLPQKIEGVLHISAYICHPLMLMLLLLALPMTIWGVDAFGKLPMSWLGVVGLGLPLAYLSSQVALYGPGRMYRWFLDMPLLFALGVGIAVNNTRAILEAILGKQSEFERTPKTGVIRRDKKQKNLIHERFTIDQGTWLEIVFSGLALVTSIFALRNGNVLGAIFFGLYACGFIWVAGATIWEARPSAALKRALLASSQDSTGLE